MTASLWGSSIGLGYYAVTVAGILVFLNGWPGRKK